MLMHGVCDIWLFRRRRNLPFSILASSYDFEPEDLSSYKKKSAIKDAFIELFAMRTLDEESFLSHT